MRKKTKPPMVEAARPAKPRTRSLAAARHAMAVDSSVALPGWRALSAISPARASRNGSKPMLSSWTTARFVLWLVVAGIAATLYVGHVQATQHTFERLYGLRKANLRLLLERDRMKGELSHATGPTVIYPMAQQLGLREGFEYGPTLSLALK